MTRTVADVPDTITFVDENDKPLPEFGEVKLDMFARSLVLSKARRSRQSIDTTLNRMIGCAIRQFISATRKEHGG